MTDHDDDTFMDDFKSAGGWVDLETFGLKTFEGMGTGAVALKDMAVSSYSDIVVLGAEILQGEYCSLPRSFDAHFINLHL